MCGNVIHHCSYGRRAVGAEDLMGSDDPTPCLLTTGDGAGMPGGGNRLKSVGLHDSRLIDRAGPAVQLRGPVPMPSRAPHVMCSAR